MNDVSEIFDKTDWNPKIPYKNTEEFFSRMG